MCRSECRDTHKDCLWEARGVSVLWWVWPLGNGGRRAEKHSESRIGLEHLRGCFAGEFWVPGECQVSRGFLVFVEVVTYFNIIDELPVGSSSNLVADRVWIARRRHAGYRRNCE